MSAYTDMYKSPKKRDQSKQRDNGQNAQNDFGQSQPNQQPSKR